MMIWIVIDSDILLYQMLLWNRVNMGNHPQMALINLNSGCWELNQWWLLITMIWVVIDTNVIDSDIIDSDNTDSNTIYRTLRYCILLWINLGNHTIIMLNKGNYPQMGAIFRLVKYGHLPTSMMIIMIDRFLWYGWNMGWHGKSPCC